MSVFLYNQMFGTMTQTALYQRLASEARRGLYNGAETAAAFTDPTTELRALITGCGVFDLGWRVKIEARGEDRVRWLNGMVTNNVKDLPLHHGNYDFLLSSQGRILADMYIYNQGEFLLLDTDRAQVETVIKTLDHFIIMDDVELRESKLNAIGICGPTALQALEAAGIHASGLELLEIRELAGQAGMSVARGPEQKPDWYELWQQATGNRQQERQEQQQIREQGTGDRGQKRQEQQQNPLTTEDTEESRGRLQRTGDRGQQNGQETTGNWQQENQQQQQNQHESIIHTDQAAIWDRLLTAGAQPVGSDALELWRIMHGIPRYGQDIRERDLPQETEQTQALNFTKGCYIGQEIVERIRSRGQVHRKFTGFEFQDSLPQPGKFEVEGRVMGEITSVAEIGGKRIGLGYIRREAGLPGAMIKVGESMATVITPPFGISI